MYEPVLGLSSARNTGWQQAQGKYVGYLDDDACGYRPGLKKHCGALKMLRPMPEWVGGPIELEWEVDAPSWITQNTGDTLGYVNWGNMNVS